MVTRTAATIGRLAPIASMGPTMRAASRTTVFVLKVLPTLPSGVIDRITPSPVRERVRYPTRFGETEGEIARPASPGPHPGIVVSLGVVPFGIDHPQVPRLQAALARAGFVTLLHWSPAMRDWRLDPDDTADLAAACAWLMARPGVDPHRVGLFGTCVGGAFALMAAADERVRDRLAFVGAFSPYASMHSFIRDVTTASWERDGARQPWAVDPLTRKVFVQSLTAWLEPGEAARLRAAMAEPDGTIDTGRLSPEGRAVHRLLSHLTDDEVDAAIASLPASLRARLDALSPLPRLAELRAPVIVLMHDRDDPVIPRTESLRLREALRDQPGLRYTKFVMFKHLDPGKVHLTLLPLLRELGRFWLSVYPLFRSAASRGKRTAS